MYASLDQGASKSCSRGSKASGDAAGEGCDDARPTDSAATMVRSIVSVVRASFGFRVCVGLRPHGCVRPQIWIPRSYGGMIESPHPLLCWVTIGLKHSRLERRQITVFLEPAYVEMRHLVSLCREFPPGFVRDAGRELIVSELGPARAWRISARSVRLHW